MYRYEVRCADNGMVLESFDYLEEAEKYVVEEEERDTADWEDEHGRYLPVGSRDWQAIRDFYEIWDCVTEKIVG